MTCMTWENSVWTAKKFLYHLIIALYALFHEYCDIVNFFLATSNYFSQLIRRNIFTETEIRIERCSGWNRCCVRCANNGAFGACSPAFSSLLTISTSSSILPPLTSTPHPYSSKSYLINFSLTFSISIIFEALNDDFCRFVLEKFFVLFFGMAHSQNEVRRWDYVSSKRI